MDTQNETIPICKWSNYTGRVDSKAKIFSKTVVEAVYYVSFYVQHAGDISIWLCVNVFKYVG